MGLDMYLYLQTGTDKPKWQNYDEPEPYEYVANWDFHEPEGWDKLPPLMQAIADEGSPHGHVWEGGCEVVVAYWRKDNAIHQWFVENVQGGVDECQRSPEVHVEQLAYLMKLCNDVIADPSRAHELLPPQSGFFFGGTEIDEWYMRGLQHTVDRLYIAVSALMDIPDAKVYYQSSW